MEGRRAPQGLEAEDRIALGLTAQHLAYLVVASLAAYTVLTGPLPGVVKYPVAVFTAALGALLAWGRVAQRPVDTWLWLAVRYYTRPHRSPAVVHALDHVSDAGEPAQAKHDPQRDAGPTVADLPHPAEPRQSSPPARSEADDATEERGRILTLHRDVPPVLVGTSPPSQNPAQHQNLAPVFIGTTQRVAFFSLKGGAGKTTLACEVASLLARDGRQRMSPEAPPERLRVALLDLDMGSANVSMRLGLTHPTLWDLVVDSSPEADGVEDCLLEHADSGLRVLLGPPRAIANIESRAIAIQRIAQVLSHLDRHHYHFVFIDMGGEVNELSTYVLEAAHRVYYVLTPTASGVQDTYRGVETLRRMGHRQKLRFVLNQGRGGFDPGEMLADLGGELAATVARDDAFISAEDEHRPAALSAGEARNSVALLAAAIYPGFVDVPAPLSMWRRLRQRLG